MITAETVNRIVRFSSTGLPVVSLYGRVEGGASRPEVRSRVLSLLDQIRPRGRDQGLDHRSRLSVRADIERIAAALTAERWPPGGIAIFSCSGRDLYHEIPLPSPVHEQVIVDPAPFVRPMLAVLSEYSRACVLVLDTGSAPIWEVYHDEILELGTIKDPNYRRIVRVLHRLLHAEGYDVLIIGGHPHELPEFLRFLPRQMRVRVAGTFTADPAAVSPAELRGCASLILSRHQLRQDELRFAPQG